MVGGREWHGNPSLLDQPENRKNSEGTRSTKARSIIQT